MISNVDENKEGRNAHKLLWRMQNGVGTRKNSSLDSH